MSVPGAAAPLGAWELADEWRRRQGRLLDLFLHRTETPSRVILRRPEVSLRAYGNGGTGRPPVVIVPAPIKRGYIWDLAPGISVVARCLEAGLTVYMLEWSPLRAERSDDGLAAYADRLVLECLDAVGQPAVLAGHSLGGTMAAIFASLHPDRVRGLALLEAPLGFGRASGAITAYIRRTYRTGGAGVGRVPGTLLDMFSVSASPEEFLLWRSRDRLASLSDPRALPTHLLVERWSLDEFPMPGRLFEEVVNYLYREDRLVGGGLPVGPRQAHARRVTAPLIGVVDPHSDIVPPASMRPFFAAARSRDKQLLQYEGDSGVALRHVGVLVGRNAHASVWPRLLEWVRRR